jgi:hypothetical protein
MNSDHYNKILSEIRIGKPLKKNSDKIHFPKKLEEANKTLKKVGLPDTKKSSTDTA